MCLLTFCDANKPAILKGLAETDSPFFEIRN